MPLPLGFPGSEEDDPFAAAAARTRQAVRPEGGRQEGLGTFLAEQFPRHVLEGLLTLPQRATQAAGELQRQGDVYDPGPALEAATMTMGATPFGAPRGAMGAGPIKAYHGSPHDFERFDLSKIGTGEGAQAYGHGLYFAENPKVAQEYRDVLTRRPVNDAGIDPAVAGGAVFDIAAKSGDLINGKIPFGPTRSLLTRDQIVSGFQQGKYSPFDLSPTMQRQIVDQIKPPGRMYEVNINAAPEQFLDWDKTVPKGSPLREMIAENAMKRTGSVYANERNAAKDAFLSAQNENLTGEGAYQSLARTLATPGAFPEIMVRRPAAATDALREAGIPGIKYLDQGSRFNPAVLPNTPMANEARQFLEAAKGDPNAALQLFRESNPVNRYGTTERDEIQRIIKAGANQPTSNYVLFRDDIIDILRKYGLAGLAPAAGAAATAGQEAPLPLGIPQSQ